VADSGIHWAEPYSLSADEILANMHAGQGVRISTYDPTGVNILFANGSVRHLPLKMPLSLWRKILAGEVTNYANIESQIGFGATDVVDVYRGEPGLNIWAVIVWLIAVGMFFRRAIKSRKPAENLKMMNLSAPSE
jgi:hypothetical protein